MRARPVTILLTGLFLASFLFVFQAPDAAAAVIDCTTADAPDPTGDVERSPADAQQTDAVTGFPQLDFVSLCIGESATGTFIVVTVDDPLNTVAARDFSWTLDVLVNGTQPYTASFRHVNDQGTPTPAGAAESQADRIQFNFPKSQFPLLSLISGIKLASAGTFAPQVGQTVTGTDQMPDEGVLNVTHLVGERAPADSDVDGDGVPDRDEISQGSNPNVRDSDGDGIEDGDDAAPTNPDADGDDFIDGLDPDPSNPDVDGDGLKDGDERQGTTARSRGISSAGFFPDAAGSTNPRDNDTDNDTLSDFDEVNRNPPTDPNNADSDGDGVPDGEEVRVGSDPSGGGGGGDGGGDGGAGDRAGDDVVTYLPISAVALIIIILLSVGGIFWRWG